MTRKLSPKMTAALKLEFQAELGVSRSDQSVARSGIIEGYMIPTNTSCALIDRGLHTRLHMVHGERWSQAVHQITAAGCEAIGRSMDEIVAWAWDQAYTEYWERATLTAGNMMIELPVEVGAVVGWTHKGEAITGTVLSIGGGYATIKGDDASPWSVSLDEIERVIEPAKAETPRRSLALDYPAAEGRVVMQMHADYCAQHGHAQHTSNGVDMGLCPRCGEPTAPRFPEGTPEYAAYATELHSELEKFAKGEPPYEYPPAASLGGTTYPAMGGESVSAPREPVGRFASIDKAAILTHKPIDSLLDSGVLTTPSDDARLSIAPPAKTFRELISAAINEAVDATQDTNGRVDKARWARHYELVTEIERRLDLAAALIPTEVRQILDGKS